MDIQKQIIQKILPASKIPFKLSYGLNLKLWGGWEKNKVSDGGMRKRMGKLQIFNYYSWTTESNFIILHDTTQHNYEQL